MRWSDDVKNLALSIYFKSPSVYRHLSSIFSFPSKSILQKDMKSIRFEPGILYHVINTLAIKLENAKPEEKMVTLSFDGMALMPHLQLIGDTITGYECFSNNYHSSMIATHALVFCIRGITTKWKQPVAFYFVKNNLSTNMLKSVIFNILSALKESMLSVVAIVCDQESRHRSLCHCLGVSGRKCSFLDRDGDEIFVMYDVPHLIKSFRNSLLAYKLFSNGEIIANFEHISSFFTSDRRGFLRMAPKLTDKHIKPNTFQKMKVKYATQLISHTVSAALKSAVEVKKLDSSALKTADTIEKMNDLFDILNCHSVTAAGFKQAIRASTYNATISKLNDYINWIESWSFQDRNSNATKVYMPFKDGFITSISSAINILNKCFACKFQFVCLNRFNQDHLENMFSLIRSYGGKNLHPTVIQCHSAIKYCSFIDLLKPLSEDKNCLSDDDSITINMSAPTLYASTFNPTFNAVIENVNECLNKRQDSLQLNVELSNSEIEFLASDYVAGYLIRYVNCHNCRKQLNGDKLSSFIKYKNFKLGALQQPCDNFKQEIQDAIRFCLNKLRFLSHLPNILTKLQNKLINQNYLLLSYVTCLNKEKCRLLLIKKFSVFIIHVFCKRVNEQLKKSKRCNLFDVKYSLRG